MNHSEALDLISASATEARLQAARYFSVAATEADLQLLKTTLAKETVPWVRRALKIAIEKISRDHVRIDTSAASGLGDDLDGLDSRQIYSKAAEEIAASVIHEFSPLVGLLRVKCAADLGEKFEGSQSKYVLDQMQVLVGAIRSLRRATATPKFASFLVNEFVADCLRTTLPDAGIDVRATGPQLQVRADKGHLAIAFANGLRNAIEAVGSFAPDGSGRVVITWGVTPSENFIVIKDNGPGFQNDPIAAMRIGATTKKDHVGFGLMLAQQAMLSMQGDILIKNDQDGAHFELRWFKEDENSIR